MVSSENISDSSYEVLNPDDSTNIKNEDGPSLEPSGNIDKDKNTKTNDNDKMDENTNSRQSHLDTDLGRIHITEEETVIENIDYVTEIENEDLKEVKTVITEERKILSDGEECITYVVTTYLVNEPESFKDLLTDDDEDDTFYTIPNDDTDIDLSLDDDETTQDEKVAPEIVDDVFFIPKGIKAQNNNEMDEAKPRKIPKLSANMNIHIPEEIAPLLGKEEFYDLTPITPVEVIDFPFSDEKVKKEKEVEAPVNKKSKTDIEIIEISSDDEDSIEQKVGKNSDFEDVSEESYPLQEDKTGLKIVEIRDEKDEKEESKENVGQNIEIIEISSDDEDSLGNETSDFSKIGDEISLADRNDTYSIVEEKTEIIVISSDEENKDQEKTGNERELKEENKQPQSFTNPIYIIEDDIRIVDISDEEDSLEENNRVDLKTELENADMYQKEESNPNFEEEGEENKVKKNKTPFEVIEIIEDKETTLVNEVYSEDSLEEETDKNNEKNNVISSGNKNTSKNKPLIKVEEKKRAGVERPEFSKAIDSSISPLENIKVEIKVEDPIQDPITPIEVLIHVPDNETLQNANSDAENLESKEDQCGKKSPFTIIYVPDDGTSTIDTNEAEKESNTISMNRNTGSTTSGDKNNSKNKSLSEVEVKKGAEVDEPEISKAIDSSISPLENIKVEIKVEDPIQDPVTPIEVLIHVPDNETLQNANSDAENLESKEDQCGKKSPFTIIYVPDDSTSTIDTYEVEKESNTTSMNRNTGSLKDFAKSNNKTDFEEKDVERYLEKNSKDAKAIDESMNKETNLNDENVENVHSSFCDVDAVGNNREVSKKNNEGGGIDFVKSDLEKVMPPIEKEILFDMGNIKMDVLRPEIQVGNQEEDKIQEIKIQESMMKVKENSENENEVKEDDQNIIETSEDEDTLDNIPEIEIDCSETNEQGTNLDTIPCNEPEVVFMVDDDAMDKNVDNEIIDDKRCREENHDTSINTIEMSFVDEVDMKDEDEKGYDKKEEAPMEIDMNKNINTENALKTKSYPDNQNFYDKENVPLIQCLENRMKKDNLASIGNKDVESVVEKCMIDLIDLITTLGIKNKETDNFYDEVNKENDPIVAYVQNKIDEIQGSPDKNMKKEPIKLSKYQQFENTPFLAIGRDIVARKPNAKNTKKGKKKTKSNKKENEALDNQAFKDIPNIIQNNQSLAKRIEEESKEEELTLYYPLGNESNISIYPIILDFEENEIEVTDTVPLMNEGDNHHEPTIEEDLENENSESFENKNEKSNKNENESHCLDIIIAEKENAKEELESAITDQTDDSSDLILENTEENEVEEIKTEFSSDDPLMNENDSTFSSMTIIDSIVDNTESISHEPLIIEEEDPLTPTNDDNDCKNSDTECKTEDDFSSDSIPEDTEERKTESSAEEPLIHGEDDSDDPMHDESEEILIITNSSDAEPLVNENKSFEKQIIAEPEEESENNDTEPLIKKKETPEESEENILTDISISEPLVFKENSSEEPISEEDDFSTTNTIKKDSETYIIETNIKDQISQEDYSSNLKTENPEESIKDSSSAEPLLSTEDSNSIEIITENSSVGPLVHEVETIINICDRKLAKPARSDQLIKVYDDALDQTLEKFEEIKTETTSLEIFHEGESFNLTTDSFEENELQTLIDDNKASTKSVTKNSEENGKANSNSNSNNEEDSSKNTNSTNESSNHNKKDVSNTERLYDNDADDSDDDENHTDSILEDSKNDETDSIKTELLLVVSNESSTTDEMILSCDLSQNDEDPVVQKGDNELFDSDTAIVNDVLEKLINKIAGDKTPEEEDIEAEREMCFSPCLIDPENILQENTESQSSPDHPPKVYVKLNVKIREELRKVKEEIAMVYAIEERTTGKKENSAQAVYIDVKEADEETATHSIDIKQANEYLAPFIGPHAEDDIPCDENIVDKKADECCEENVDDRNNVESSFEEISNSEGVDGNVEENGQEKTGTKVSGEDGKDDGSDPTIEEEINTSDAEYDDKDAAISSEEELVSQETVSETDEEELVLRDISQKEKDLIIASSLPEELELVSVINSILESIEENQNVDKTTNENVEPNSNIQSNNTVSKSDENTATIVVTMANDTTNTSLEGDTLDELVDEEESILIPLTEVQVTSAYDDNVRLDADKTNNNLKSSDLPDQSPQTSTPHHPRRKVYYPEKYPKYTPTPPPSPVYQPNQIKRSKKLFPPIPKPVLYHAEYINTNKNPRVLRRGPNQSKSADITTYTYKGSISSVGEYVSDKRMQVDKKNIEDKNKAEKKDKKDSDVYTDNKIIDNILGNTDSIEIDGNENEDSENKSLSDTKDKEPDIDDKTAREADNKELDSNNDNSQTRLKEGEKNENPGERVITHEERVKRRKKMEEEKQYEEASFTGEKVISAKDRRLRRLRLIKVE